IVAEDKRAGEVIRRLRAPFKKGEKQFQRLDANDVVREALDLAHGDMVTRDIEISTDLSPRLPAVTADRGQMQQVLLNLLVNASEAMSDTPPGERRLTVSTQPLSGGGVQLSVADRGPGIPEDRQARLFQALFNTKPPRLGPGVSVLRSPI